MLHLCSKGCRDTTGGGRSYVMDSGMVSEAVDILGPSLGESAGASALFWR